MITNKDEPKHLASAVGSVTTYIYEGPITGTQKSGNTERPKLIDGKTRLVTYVYEGPDWRLKTE